MSATYVTAAELRTNLGIGTLYPEAMIEEICQSAQDLCDQFLWYDASPVVGAYITGNVATLALGTPSKFVIGQSVTVAACGSIYNGTKTVTGTIPSTNATDFPVFSTIPRGVSFIQYSLTHADDVYHPVLPYGKVTGDDTKTLTYANTPAVREAAMQLAVDIYQARQVTSSGGVSADGYAPSPYRMGNSLMGKVRGLLAPYSNPASMVG